MGIEALITALGSIGGGYLGGKSGGQKETKIQKQKRKLIDDLLASLQGNGSFNGLFENDYDVFQKSFVDPMKSKFNNQIAPQIQQNYIASGQQRGTGLDDTLQRAGVDLDQLLNQEYMGFQQKGQDRIQSMINTILGSGDGAAPSMSSGQAFGQAGAGYLSSDGFRDSVKDIANQYAKKPLNPSDPQPGTGRAGYAY